MELQISNNNLNGELVQEEVRFIESNTIPVSLKEMNDKHLIPVFVKDNEPIISHSQFVSAMIDETHTFFGGIPLMPPNVRVSHPIKGRIPEAKGKAAKELEEWEKTIYYERMAFCLLYTSPSPRD